MAFGTATVETISGLAICAKRHVGASPTQAEPLFVAIGTGATAAARTAVAADTALSTEVETRAAGTSAIVTVTNGNDTYQVTGTVTATSAIAVDEAATFDAATGGAIDISATFSPAVALGAGESLQITFKKTFG